MRLDPTKVSKIVSSLIKGNDQEAKEAATAVAKEMFFLHDPLLIHNTQEFYDRLVPRTAAEILSEARRLLKLDQWDDDSGSSAA